VLGAASGGLSPLVIIGGVALLLGLGIGGYAFWQQRRRAEMVRRYQEAQALARTRRGQGQRGPRGPNGGYGNSGSYGNGRQPAMRGGPPQRYDRPQGSSQPGQRRPPASPGGRPPRQSGRDEW